jgi:hypothetical protein
MEFIDGVVLGIEIVFVSFILLALLNIYRGIRSFYQLRKISKAMQTPAKIVPVYGHRHTDDLRDIWFDEFATSLQGSELTKTICALCGNYGVLNTADFNVTNSLGYKVVPIKPFCICPNGRAIKSQHETNQKRKANASKNL